MNRRSLLQLLAGFLAPDIASSARSQPSPDVVPRFSRSSAPDLSQRPSQSLSTTYTASSPISSSADVSDLEGWQRLPMQPLVTFEDFSAYPDREQILGCVILEHIKSQTDFEFRYHGGSDPGTTRRVLPILLFRKFEMAYDHHDHPHVYLLAFCQTRQQARTFRLDRIQPVAAINGRPVNTSSFQGKSDLKV